MKDLEYYKNKAEEYNDISSDMERLEYLKKNQEDFIVRLDNDISFVNFKNFDKSIRNEIEEIDLNCFDNCHYWSEGNLILFKFAGIEAEFV